MTKTKRIEVGNLIEFNGTVGRVKQIFERPTYFVEDLVGLELFVAASEAKRVSPEAEIEIWKQRAEAAEVQPKTVTFTLERDGVINGMMLQAGQYKVTEYVDRPMIITRVETVEQPERPLVHVPAEDDAPYTAHCTECDFTQQFPDEADAAADMMKAGWRFEGGSTICPNH